MRRCHLASGVAGPMTSGMNPYERIALIKARLKAAEAPMGALMLYKRDDEPSWSDVKFLLDWIDEESDRCADIMREQAERDDC